MPPLPACLFRHQNLIFRRATKRSARREADSCRLCYWCANEGWNALSNRQSGAVRRYHHGSLEVAKRSPTYGALLISLPLVSILAMIWLWRDTGDGERIAVLSEGTFWLVLPTLPISLVLPALIRHGVAFWVALAVSCALTVVLYLVAVWLLPKLGINF